MKKSKNQQHVLEMPLKHSLFDADYRDAIYMNIFRIGELANQLIEEFKEKNNDIPWDQMYGIKNRLAYAYIKVNDAIIRGAVKNDIHKLKEKLDEML